MLRGCLVDIEAQADLCINQMDQTRCAFMYENVHFDPHSNTFIQDSVKRNIRPSTLPSLDTVLFLMQNSGCDFTDKRNLEIDLKPKKIKENGEKHNLVQTARLVSESLCTRGLTSQTQVNTFLRPDKNLFEIDSLLPYSLLKEFGWTKELSDD